DDNPFEDDLEVETGPEPTETVIVRTEGQLKAMVASLITSELVSFDLETTSLNKMTAEIVGIAICGQSPRAYYIPVGHVVGSAEEEGQMDLFAEKSEGISLAPDQLPLEKVLKALKPVMTDPDVGKVAHNAKFDYAILKYHGLEVTPIVFDTMIGEWLTNPSTKFKKLKELSTHRLMITMTEIQALIGKGKKAINFAAVPIDDAAPYAAADADVTLRLVEPIKAELGEQNMENLVELEMALIPVLTDMETAGIGVNRAFFKEMAKELGQELTELESAIHTIAGRSFNMNSTQQLSDVLFKELNIPHEGVKKTKSGHFSTNAQILNDLKPQDETGIIEKILQYREYNKLKSTYVDALPQMINQKTNRIHTNFNQTGTVTGRVASNDPNLQNIPIRTEVGRRIRRGFVAKPGHRFIAADYSQVELRILAHISQDEALINAFRNDQDIHRTTAAAVYGIEPEEVQFEQRRFAKNVNFGLMYGMGAFRLARESELTLAESREFIETYFKRFPAVRRYLDGTKELARQQGYVETLLGRRRYFPIFKTPGSEGLKAQAEREAINHPIQGTAADIIKIAMIELHKILSANYKTKMILQIHDELILEAPEDEIEEIKPLMEKTMSQAYKLDVPLKVEASVGKNWLDVKD
ncbi:MAG: DNA polymerase I, partial [Chloroflexota bacterium]